MTLAVLDSSASTSASMTSQEISSLTGSRHDNVKRTIEVLAEKGVIEFPQTEEISTATKPATVYSFTGAKGFRDSLVVVAQLCPEFTAKVIDRWQELEAKETQAKELAFRKAYNLTEGDYEMIRLLGKEVAAYTALTQQMFAEAYDRVGQLNLPPGKGARMINEVYNHGIARLRTMQRIRDKQADELAKVSLQVRLAESKALIAEHKLKELNYKKLLK